jgi:hypothetical protein
LDNLIAKMSASGAGVQGSGWVWLGLIKDSKLLKVETTANQDPLAAKGLVPLLGIDVWEHAYYLQYKNVDCLLQVFLRGKEHPFLLLLLLLLFHWVRSRIRRSL